MDTVEGTPSPEVRDELLTASAAAHTLDSFARTLVSNALQTFAHSVGDSPLEGQSIQATIFVRRSRPPATDDPITYPHVELCVHIPAHGEHPEHLACVYFPPPLPVFHF